ncbi:regulatory protein RecX [Solicola gregarius]|uniref:Regulatory protein RecX n=1 Tax=Solicola gregarius TaxID=2908642 RepID=A0AA46YKG7_9ACTN|nr:regulatory protein RecX [Solicola gregarius]UYM04559.1 recombination regulator RecX [Solicola gregarius]
MRPDPSDWQTPAEPHVSAPESRNARPKRAAQGGRRGRRKREPEDAEARDLGPDADPEAVARKILLQRLTEQPRSRTELERALAKRDVPADVAARLLDRFEEIGLVDDEAFARSWVESRQRTRGLAGRALAQELRRKGVDDETVRETVDDIDPDDERENARLLVRKKLRSVRSLDRQVQVRRLAGMLARKGYSSGLAYAVIREELDVELDPDL